MPDGFRDSGQMCQVATTPNFEKNQVNQILPPKNWLAEARQFQISMFERADCTGKVGLSQHSRRT